MKHYQQNQQRQRTEPETSQETQPAIRPHHEGATVEVEERVAGDSRVRTRRVVVGRYTIGPSGLRKPVA
jgi:hypothetical protein